MSEHDLELRALATILSTGLSDESGFVCVCVLRPPPTLFVVFR